MLGLKLNHVSKRGHSPRCSMATVRVKRETNLISSTMHISHICWFGLLRFHSLNSSMNHIFDLMMATRWIANGLKIIKEPGQLIANILTYCIMFMENENDNRRQLRHTLDRIWIAVNLYIKCIQNAKLFDVIKCIYYLYDVYFLALLMDAQLISYLDHMHIAADVSQSPMSNNGNMLYKSSFQEPLHIMIHDSSRCW